MWKLKIVVFAILLMNTKLFSQIKTITNLNEKQITIKSKVVSYQVTKPKSWKAEINLEAGFVTYQNDSQIIHSQPTLSLFKNTKYDFQEGGVAIEIINIEKKSKSLEGVIQKQTQDYEQEFGKFRITELNIKSEKYESISKLYEALDEGSDFKEYSIFINPGERFKYVILISLLSSHGSRLATVEELETLNNVVHSFLMLK